MGQIVEGPLKKTGLFEYLPRKLGSYQAQNESKMIFISGERDSRPSLRRRSSNSLLHSSTNRLVPASTNQSAVEKLLPQNFRQEPLRLESKHLQFKLIKLIKLI